MNSEIIYLSPKSKEAKYFFDKYMGRLHSCKVLKREDDKILLKPITQNRVFWIREHNDENWKRI